MIREDWLLHWANEFFWFSQNNEMHGRLSRLGKVSCPPVCRRAWATITMFLSHSVAGLSSPSQWSLPALHQNGPPVIMQSIHILMTSGRVPKDIIFASLRIPEEKYRLPCKAGHVCAFNYYSWGSRLILCPLSPHKVSYICVPRTYGFVSSMA